MLAEHHLGPPVAIQIGDRDVARPVALQHGRLRLETAAGAAPEHQRRLPPVAALAGHHHVDDTVAVQIGRGGRLSAGTRQHLALRRLPPP